MQLLNTKILKFILYIVIITVVLSCNNKKNEVNLERQIKRLENHIAIIQNARLSAYNLNEKTINANLMVLNTEGDSILFKSLLSSKNSLIIFFSDEICSSCLEKELQRIEHAFSMSFISENIILLIKCSTLIKLQAYKNSMGGEFNTYLCLNNLFDNNTNIESILVFVTNKNLVTNLTYFPDKSIDLENFYTILRNKYF